MRMCVFIIIIIIIIIHLEPAQRSRYSDWLRAGRPRGRSSSPGRGQEFSLLHVVHPDCGAHPASYPMGTGGSFPGSKAAGAWSCTLTSN
jgi:hypothetical protein